MNVDILRIAAHRRNISRYKRLLRTDLNEVEREFVDRRLEEERSALAQLIADRRLETQPAAGISGSASDPTNSRIAKRNHAQHAGFRSFAPSRSHILLQRSPDPADTVIPHPESRLLHRHSTVQQNHLGTVTQTAPPCGAVASSPQAYRCDASSIELMPLRNVHRCPSLIIGAVPVMALERRSPRSHLTTATGAPPRSRRVASRTAAPAMRALAGAPGSSSAWRLLECVVPTTRAGCRSDRRRSFRALPILLQCPLDEERPASCAPSRAWPRM